MADHSRLIYADQTAMRLNQNCEPWKVRSDNPRKTFDEWLDEQAGGVPVEAIARNAYVFASQYHAATLRRIGWLDQKGRVWLETPAGIDFDGGSLTPLLVDARED